MIYMKLNNRDYEKEFQNALIINQWYCGRIRAQIIRSRCHPQGRTPHYQQHYKLQHQNSNILSFSWPWLTDVSLTFTFLLSLNSDSEKDNQQQRQNTIHSGQILESEGNNQHVKRSRNEITGPGSRWFAIETFFVKFTCMLPKFTSCIKSIYKVAWQIQISKYIFEFNRFRRFSFYKIRKNMM